MPCQGYFTSEEMKGYQAGTVRRIIYVCEKSKKAGDSRCFGTQKTFSGPNYT